MYHKFIKKEQVFNSNLNTYMSFQFKFKYILQLPILTYDSYTEWVYLPMTYIQGESEKRGRNAKMVKQHHFPSNMSE